MEDDEDEEDGMEGEGDGRDEEGFADEELDEQDMQAHGKVHREQTSVDYDDGEDEDACRPSFERCSIRDAGHLCHPPPKAGGRPQNPMGYDDDDASDDDGLPEGLSRHSH